VSLNRELTRLLRGKTVLSVETYDKGWGDKGQETIGLIRFADGSHLTLDGSPQIEIDEVEWYFQEATP